MRTVWLRSLVLVSISTLEGADGFVTPSLKQTFRWGGSLNVAASVEKQAVEEEYFDEDDFDFDEKRSFEDFYVPLWKISRKKQRNKKAVPQAEQVFDDMYNAFVMTDDPSLWPNTTIYNMLLDIHAWSTDGENKAQHILDRMEDSSIDTVARPDRRSYMYVMESWSNRNEPEKAEQVLDRLNQKFEKTGDERFRPDTNAYNKLIKAYMKSGNAEKSEEILNNMIQKAEDGEEHIKPNQKSFVQVMRAYGIRHDEGSVDKVRELFQLCSTKYRSTGDESFEPNTLIYNELIAAIAQNPNIPDRATQAEAILYEMLEAYNTAGIEVLKPKDRKSVV